LKGSPFGKFSEAHQRRRATAIAHRNATNRLASGAARVMSAMVESGLPGRRDSATASLSRSAAVLRAPVTSPIVRDTSVAVSMARSAMPGCGINCGVSMLTGNYSGRVGNKRGRHLWLSARALVFEQRAQRPLAICDRRRGERRMAASSRKCRADNFVPPLAQENVLPPVDRETG
jgi:hypothetical protein